MRRGADPRLMALLVVGGACVQLPATTPAQKIGGSRAPPRLRAPPLPATRCGGCCMRAERADPGEIRASATLSAPPRSVPDVSLWTWLKGSTSGSFHDFMREVRDAHGDVSRVNLWPVLPPIYLMMGKSANRGVLSELDASLEQVLQDLINFLPVSANIPSEVDVELQKKVASLFQSVSTVNARLPSFVAIAERMKSRWLAMPADEPLNIFFELSEFVLRADLEIL